VINIIERDFRLMPKQSCKLYLTNGWLHKLLRLVLKVSHISFLQDYIFKVSYIQLFDLI